MKIEGGCYCGEIRFDLKEMLKLQFNVIVENVNI